MREVSVKGIFIVLEVALVSRQLVDRMVEVAQEVAGATKTSLLDSLGLVFTAYPFRLQ
jgi:hypothetical protein